MTHLHEVNGVHRRSTERSGNASHPHGKQPDVKSTSHKHTSKTKIVDRLKSFVKHVRLFFLPLLLELGLRSPPPRIEQLRKVYKSKAGGSTSPASKVEDDSGLHRSEKGITRARSSIVHKV